MSHELVLNDLLRFVFYYNKKHHVKLIKSMVLDFYSAENISNAKDQLTADITKLNVPNTPRIVARRSTNDNKPRLDLDDLFAWINFGGQEGNVRPSYLCLSEP